MFYYKRLSYKFKRLKIETIENLLNIFSIKQEPTLRTLLEILIPRLGECLGLDKDFSYKDLFYSIYEKKLEENNMNKVKLQLKIAQARK